MLLLMFLMGKNVGVLEALCFVYTAEEQPLSLHFQRGQLPRVVCVCTSEHCQAGVPSRSPKGVVGATHSSRAWWGGERVGRWKQEGERIGEEKWKEWKPGGGARSPGLEHTLPSWSRLSTADSSACPSLPQPDLGSLGLIVHCCSIMLKSLSRSWLLCWVGCLFFWSFVLPALGCLCYLLSKTF